MIGYGIFTFLFGWAAYDAYTRNYYSLGKDVYVGIGLALIEFMAFVGSAIEGELWPWPFQ